MHEHPSLDLDIAKLVSWVEFETPTRDGPAVNRLVDHIEREAIGFGATARRWQGGADFGDVLLLTPPGRDTASSVLLHGHVDTVHAHGSLSGTLKPRVEDGRLYGPGVYDMKAGVLMAFQEFKRSIERPDDYAWPLSLMIVPDEEHGSVFSRAITEEIAPSYKAALVFEPGSENCGVISARKGYGEYLLTAHGKAAHAGMRPHNGQSAVLELCRQIIALEILTDDARGVSCNVGLVSGGTFTNVIPDRAVARIDLRFWDNEGWNHVRERVEALASVNPAIRLELEFVLHQPPLTKQATASMLKAVRNAGRTLGLDIEGESNGGSSDANMIADVGVPVLDGLGPQGGGAHTPFEYIDIGNYRQKAALVRTLLTGDFIS